MGSPSAPDPNGTSTLSISEVAARFDVSAETIRRWEKAGLLHPTRPDGKNRVFDRQEVDALLLKKPLTAGAAAEFFGITAKKLKELTEAGGIVPAGYGGTTYIYTTDHLQVLKDRLQHLPGGPERAIQDSNTKVVRPIGLSSVVPASGGAKRDRQLARLPKLLTGAIIAASLMLAVLLGRQFLPAPLPGGRQAPISRALPLPPFDSAPTIVGIRDPFSSSETPPSPLVRGDTTVDPALTREGSGMGLVAGITLTNNSATPIYLKTTPHSYQLDLYSDGTRFSIDDHTYPIFSVTSDKLVRLHPGSTLLLQGAVKDTNDSTGQSGEILTAQGNNQPPIWQRAADIVVGNLDCNDCLNEDQIQDIFLKNSGDTVTGTLNIGPATSRTLLVLKGAANQADDSLSIRDSSDTRLFTVDQSGDLTKIKGVTYAFPSSQGASGSVLSNDGTGTLQWGTVSQSGITADSLDFTEFQDTLDLDAALTLNQTTNTWTQSFTGTTTTGLTYTANSLTTGTAQQLSSTSTDGGASGSSKVLDIVRSGANANTAHTAYGIYSNVTNTNATSGTNIAAYLSASGATTANYGLIVANGNVGLGTTAPIGLLNVHAAASDPVTWITRGDNVAANTVTLRLGNNDPTYQTYSPYIQAIEHSGIDRYSLAFGVSKGAAATEAVRIDSTGNVTAHVGIGLTGPTAVLHLKAGTATATSAPLKFTSGTLLTTPEDGTIEYLSNQFYIRGSDGLSVAGNVGIGDTTPDALFDIDSAATTTNISGITATALTTGKAFDIATSGNTWTGNSTTSGLVNLASTSTAGTASDSDILLNITRSGANANLAHTAYGLYSNVTNTNATSGTNIAAYLSASGATTANYGLIVANGNVGIGTTAPGYKLDSTGSVRVWDGSRGGVQIGGAAGASDNAINGLNTSGTVTAANLYLNSLSSGNVNLTGGGNLGIGIANPSVKVYSLATTEQLRLGYDASNYASFTTSSAGSLTITPTGTGTGVTLAPSNATGATTSSGFVVNDTALTTGTLAYLTSSSVTTGKLLDVATSGNTWTGNSTTSGLVNLASTSTAGTVSNSDILLNITRSGANANLAHTAYGIYSNVTNTNATSGTNIAAYLSASGATTANYGLIVANGNVGIGTTAPGSLLDIGLAGSTLGTLRLEGNTSGYVQLQSAAAAGSWTLTLPTDDGTSSQVLTTNGSGVTSWTTISSGGPYTYNPAGTANEAFGSTALDSLQTGGDNNAGFGNAAGTAVTTGDNNAFFGYQAGTALTTGTDSIAIGYQALDAATTVSGLVAIGSGALGANTTGTQNLAIGYNALLANDTGTDNIAIGYAAMDAIVGAGNFNIGIGTNALGVNTTGDQNVAIGYNALGANTTADRNTAIGYNALGANTVNTRNVALGYNALAANTTAPDNTAIGYNALGVNTTGDSNVALGSGALDANTTASNNTAIGYNALGVNTTGTRNVALGYNVLDANTTASDNTAIGDNALGANTTGASNVALGSGALNVNTTASNNVGIGLNALGANTTGTPNIAIGYQALLLNVTGTDNIALGKSALDANTTNKNIAIGTDALGANTTGTPNIAIGFNALLLNDTGTDNIAIGNAALDANAGAGNFNIGIGTNALGLSTTGDKNIALGYGALDANTTAGENIGVGYDALGANTTGANNLAIGTGAMTLNTTGGNNTAVGYSALYQNSTVNGNTAIGYSAMFGTTTGDYNTALGYLVLDSNTTGVSNVALGTIALNDSTTADNTVAVGYDALGVVTTGDNNTALGYQAGDNITTGSANLIIGYDIDAPSATSANDMSIGNLLFSDLLDGTGTTVSTGNLGLRTSTFGTSAVGVVAIANGTAPTSSIVDGIQFWAEDVAASSELRVRDEATNVTTLSPHNFSLFSPDDNDYHGIEIPWSFYSKNEDKGQEINVDMLGALQAVETLTGEQFVFARDTRNGADIVTNTTKGVGIKDEESGLVQYVTLNDLLPSLAAFDGVDAKLAALQSEVERGTVKYSEVEARLAALEGSPNPEVLGATTEPSANNPPIQQLNNTTDLDLKSLVVHEDITVYGTLLADTIETATALVTHGDATIWGKLLVKGDVEISANARVTGTLTISTQQAGFAEIPAGATEVHILFTPPFDSAQGKPVVSITPRGLSSIAWGLVDDTADGFTIKLAAPAAEKLSFTWTAFPVNNALNSEGQGSLPAEVAGQQISATPSPELSSLPPSPSPSPSATPAETLEPSPSPAVVNNPTIEQSSTTGIITILPTGLIDDTGVEILRVRATPSSNSDQVGTVVVGSILPYTQEVDGWFELTLGDGAVGWVSGEFAAKTVPAPG